MLQTEELVIPTSERKYQNPYGEKLEQYKDFVFRDKESEHFQGQWNRQVFQREAELHLEIGCGGGEFLQSFCQQYPHINLVGLDFRFKRSFKTAKKLSLISQSPESEGKFYTRYLRAWAERLPSIFGPQELDAIYLFFPDPWPKTRHFKKRLLQKTFFVQMHKLLKTGSSFYFKTDHLDLFTWVLKQLEAPECASLFTKELITTNLRQDYPEHFLSSFQTGFETLFLKQGKTINALVLKAR
jgi:tRNA (guanine-N7-)-methyltransferase